eukprot:Gb_32990 [translate_table: standard]
MVSGSLASEIVSPLPPSRLWKALIKDGHNLLPKLLPEFISTIDILQGDGASVGTIKQFNFTAANKKFNYTKDRVDELDEEKFVYKYTALEGGLIGSKVSTATFEIKFESTADGGTKSTFTSKFETISDSLPSEVEVEELKAETSGMFKAVEAYLLANPTVYV